MGKAFILALILFGISQIFFSFFKKRHRFFSRKLMNILYWYHLVFWLIYYIYVQFNPSDTGRYFDAPQTPGYSWGDFYGTSTTFIDFLSYPFINYLNFNFEMIMMLFAWFGYLGFIFAYVFFRENIPVQIRFFKRWDLLVILLFLPNMHFWTAALAKGAPIFLGLMMYAYAVKKPGKRILLLLLGSLLVYHVRPHVYLFVVVGTLLGYISGRAKIPVWQKVGVFSGMIAVFLLIQDEVLTMIGIQEAENLVEGFETFSEERSEALLESGGSGVDLASYPLPVKLFTFWFRPLFIDAPNIFGFFSSLENLLYLIIVAKIIRKDFFGFLKRSPLLVKMSLVIFFLTSFAMTFVMSNLGIIIRQKSQVMYFLFFVVYYYLAQKKYDKIMKMRRIKQRHVKASLVYADQNRESGK